MALYVTPTTATQNYSVADLLTVGQEIPLIEGTVGNFKTTDKTFAFAGIPDGLGIYETKDNYYVFVNHEIADVRSGNTPLTSNISNTVAGKIQGSRVSLLVFDKLWKPIGGKNLIDTMLDSTGRYSLDLNSGKYVNATNGKTFSFSRFCSGYLAESGFVDGSGKEVPVFFAPEESNNSSRGFAVFPNGEATAIEGLGRYAKENVVAASQYRATNSEKTVLFSTEDFRDGELYMWVGQQTATDPNGFEKGDLYALRVGSAAEESQIPTTVTGATWVKIPQDAALSADGLGLQSFANRAGNSTNFRRLEDMDEDPNQPGTFYFATTGTADKVDGTTTTRPEEAENPYGRLYRFSLNASDPTGPISNFELVLTGGPGKGVSYDNIDVDRQGNVLLQEDETAFGGSLMKAEKREAGIWSFDPKSKAVTPLFYLNESAAGAQFNKADTPGEWETSGIVSGTSKRPFLLFDVQAHTIADSKYVEGGQLVLAIPAEADRLTTAGTGEILHGHAGADTIASTGSGNTLYGGRGADTLTGGTGDRLLGDRGEDVLNAGNGNTLTGGAAADQFWIATTTLPAQANVITDFVAGTDRIGLRGIAGVSQFSSLQITASGANALIRANGQEVAIINNTAPSALSASSFVFA